MTWCPYCKKDVEIITFEKTYSHVTYIPFHDRTTETRTKSELKCKNCFIRILYPDAKNEEEFNELINKQMEDEIPKRISDLQTKLKIAKESEFLFSFWYEHSRIVHLGSLSLSIAVIISSILILSHNIPLIAAIIGINIVIQLWLMRINIKKNADLDKQKEQALIEFLRKKNMEVSKLEGEIKILKELSPHIYLKEILRHNRITSLKGETDPENDTSSQLNC
jgi:hypothetical protein